MAAEASTPGPSAFAGGVRLRVCSGAGSRPAAGTDCGRELGGAAAAGMANSGDEPDADEVAAAASIATSRRFSSCQRTLPGE